MSVSSFEAPLDTPADWTVLADWLTERGDPRGEWLHLEHHLATLAEGPKHRQLRARLVGEFQPIGKAQAERLTSKLGRGEAEWIEASWRCGLVVEARVSPGLAARDPQVIEAITTLLDSSAALVLGKLHLGDAPTSACRKALLAGPARASLRELTLGDFRQPVGELAPLAAKLPNLRSLELRGPEIGLAGAQLANLHTLRLHCEEEFDEPLAAISTGCFSTLRALHLRLGGRRYATLPNHLARLETLLSGRATPKLGQLGLTATEFADRLIDPLADSPLLARLTTLDLSDSWLTDAGAERLLDRADAFEHLDRLELASSHISDGWGHTLEDSFGERIHLGLQVRGMTWDPVARAFETTVVND